MRKLASELGLSEGSVRNIVKSKLGLRSYRINKAHFLDDRMKAQRLQKCRVMKRRSAGLRLQRVLFTDEKIFTIERHHNCQNHRQLLHRKGLAARLIERSHYPQSVMVWGGICATGKTPLVFINRNVKINSQVYQNEILRGVVHPWAMEHFGENNFFFATRLGTGTRSKFNDSAMRRAVSGILGQKCLAIQLTWFESDGLLRLVNAGTEAEQKIHNNRRTEACIAASLGRNYGRKLRGHCDQFQEAFGCMYQSRGWTFWTIVIIFCWHTYWLLFLQKNKKFHLTVQFL